MTEEHGCFNCRYQNIKVWKCNLCGCGFGISQKLHLKLKGIKTLGSYCKRWEKGTNLLNPEENKEKVKFD